MPTINPSNGLPVVLDPNEYLQLHEKGRQRALAAIKASRATKQRVEQRFGKAYCMRRYPEAYGLKQPPIFE